MPQRSRKALALYLGHRLEHLPWHHHALAAELHRCIPAQLQPINLDVVTVLLSRFRQPFSPSAVRIAAVIVDHPFLNRLFRFCRKHGVWPDPPLSPPQMRPSRAFADLSMPALTTPTELADWLCLPLEHLAGYVDRFGWREEHGDVAVNHYFTRITPKLSGGLRVIEAPKPRLKAFQRRIYTQILSLVPSHPDSFGFIPDRDCVAGASRHAGEELVISFDLKDFFSRIPYGRVFGAFRCLGYPAAVSHCLSGLCTTVTPARCDEQIPYDQRQFLRIPHLPQGAPTSPALSNIVSHRLDTRFSGLARSLGAHYSRYADDLTFSGDGSIRKTIINVVPEIIRNEGFVVNPAKTRVMTAKHRQTVTGIVVNERLNISRVTFDRIKAEIHAGAWCHDPVRQARLTGKIGWVYQLNPTKGMKLERLMERAAGRASIAQTAKA